MERGSLSGEEWPDELEGTLNKRIENAFNALENCSTAWAINYWETVLGTLLRQANRIGHKNFHLN